MKNLNDVPARDIIFAALDPAIRNGLAANRTDIILRNLESAGLTIVAKDRFAAVLKEHWLSHIQCNHENKTDKAFCSCSEMGGEECHSVGAAVQSWIDHVLEQL